jgi:hypothetical protein
MRSRKLVVTHRGRLKEKYGPEGVAAIDDAVRALAAADEGRGLLTVYVHLDDAEEMKANGSKAVSRDATAASCKKVIDRILKQAAFDYLVLLGSDDVIPHFSVPNPTFAEEGDDNDEVPTDNPYGASPAFNEKSRSSYLVTDRALGRIPDLPGATEPSALLQYLQSASESKPLSLSDFELDLMVCCDSWKASGSACVAALSREAAVLLVSPPTLQATVDIQERHKARLQMIKCHGVELDPYFYGQKASKFPEVMFATSLAGRTSPGTVVGAMCCYGAAVYDPAHPAATTPGVPSIASVYLNQQAAGFAGSTCISWVGSHEMQCADLIITRFLKNVMSGMSLGASLLDSKQRFLADINKDGRMPDAADEKTLLQFLLLGDPSLRAVKSREEEDAMVPVVGIDGLDFSESKDRYLSVAETTERPSPRTAAASERRMRRTYHSNTARNLRDTLPDRNPSEPLFTAEEILTPVEIEFVGGRKPVVHRCTRTVAQPGQSRARKMARAAAAVFGQTEDAAEVTDLTFREETLQYYWYVGTRHERVLDAKIIKVETDLHGNVLRKRVLVTA